MILAVALASGVYLKGHSDGRAGEHARVERAIAAAQKTLGTDIAITRHTDSFTLEP